MGFFIRRKGFGIILQNLVNIFLLKIYRENKKTLCFKSVLNLFSTNNSDEYSQRKTKSIVTILLMDLIITIPTTNATSNKNIPSTATPIWTVPCGIDC